MSESTKPTSNLAECGNKSKPLLYSRLFKFRAWDNCYDKMLYNGVSKDSIIAIGIEGTIFKLFMESAYEINSSLSGVFDDRFDIMQSTGLFDKNEIEIFEGDIIEQQFTIQNYTDDDVVNPRFYNIPQYETKTIKKIVVFDFLILGLLKKSEIKVIGNIFENITLL